MKYTTRIFSLALFLILAAGLVWLVAARLQEEGKPRERTEGSRAVPVEVAEIERGSIELRRTFSGALEATAEFVVAPKVGGRVERLSVDLADRVDRGQNVAQLDNAEYIQSVAQAKADLAVARANRSEAGSALEIAERKLKRIRTLRKRGVASESQLDTAKAEQLAARSRLEVAAAQATRAEASLEAARIRLGYTLVSADWTGGDDQRVVAERFVDEGNTVSANTPLMSIVELDPITGVIFVTERDYARIEPGQKARLATDAFPDEQFAGRVSRIAPVFKEATRQARVELIVENPGHLLKPGMFIRVSLMLDQARDAVIVPETALTRRNDRDGVFVIDEETMTVSWREIVTGIQGQERVQIKSPELSGRVVTLGQQMLDHGTPVSIPSDLNSDTSLSGEAGKR
ncbi:MAG: efflux RND transporter periplasmic adaptor subunit [Thermodesulfobacteriota bacterium]